MLGLAVCDAPKAPERDQQASTAHCLRLTASDRSPCFSPTAAALAVLPFDQSTGADARLPR
jgi:proline racemase